MFGIHYLKLDSMTYATHYVNGSIKREGRGLSFFYYEPTSSITAVPAGTIVEVGIASQKALLVAK